jgi:hypothetical protein
MTEDKKISLWERIALSLYVGLKLNATRIKVYWEDSPEKVRYIPEYLYSGSWYSLKGGDSFIGFESIEEAQSVIDKFRVDKVEELTKEFLTPKVRYIKYP